MDEADRRRLTERAVARPRSPGSSARLGERRVARFAGERDVASRRSAERDAALRDAFDAPASRRVDHHGSSKIPSRRRHARHGRRGASARHVARLRDVDRRRCQDRRALRARLHARFARNRYGFGLDGLVTDASHQRRRRARRPPRAHRQHQDRRARHGLRHRPGLGAARELASARGVRHRLGTELQQLRERPRERARCRERRRLHPRIIVARAPLRRRRRAARYADPTALDHVFPRSHRSGQHELRRCRP